MSDPFDNIAVPVNNGAADPFVGLANEINPGDTYGEQLMALPGEPGYTGKSHAPEPKETSLLDVFNNTLKKYGRTVLDQSLQGATFNTADEVTDRIGAGIASVATGVPYDVVLQDARDASKKRLEAQFRDNPYVAIGSNLAGGLLTGAAAASTKAGAALANSLGSGGVAARVAKGALAGSAANSAYAVGAQQGDVGQRVANAGFDQTSLANPAISGAVVGGAIPAVGATLSGVKNAVLPVVDDAVKGLAQKAVDYGIPLSRSQIGDSRFAKVLASTAEKVPLAGGTKFYQRQQIAFNKAIAKTIGEDANKITPEVIDTAYRNIGKRFDDVLSGRNINITDDILKKFSEIDDAAKASLTDDQYRLVDRQIGRVLKDISPDGTISGEKINSLRSSLTKIVQRVKNDASPFLSDLQDAVIDASVDGFPKGRELLNTARLQYKNLKTIEPLAAKAARGDISPALLQGRVTAQFKDFARGGGGELGDLARIGQAFIKDAVPNSGTPERLAAYGALFGGPGAVVGGGAGAAVAVPAGIGAAKAFNAVNTSQALVRSAIKKTGNAAPLAGLTSGIESGAIAHQMGKIDPARPGPLRLTIRPERKK